MREMMGIYGFLLTIVLLCVILVPYLLKRGHLVTPKNIILLGGVNFLGMATITSAYGEHIPRLIVTHHEYDSSVYMLFMIGATLFFVTFFLAYHLFTPARRIADRIGHRWPTADWVTMNKTVYVLAIATVASFFVALSQIPVIAQFASETIVVFSVMAAGLAAWTWLGNRSNIIYLLTAIAMILLAVGVAFIYGIGRRNLVTVFGCLLAAWYWGQLQNNSPIASLFKLLVAGIILLAILQTYSSIRHQGMEIDNPLERSTARLGALYENLRMPELINMGGDTTNNTLWAIDQFYIRENAPKDRFAIIEYIVAHPVPRAFYPGKPSGFGYLLPRLTYGHIGQSNTWGPGIIGHCFYEGGLIMTIFYGLLIGISVRFLDELLLSKQNSPYAVIAIFAASGQFLAFLRGDVGLFGVKIIFAVGAAFVFYWVYHKITNQCVNYPNPRLTPLSSS